MGTLPISFDQGMIDQIAREFDLREPNKEGLRQLIFNLTGNFNPIDPLVMNMATGSGKTYLMAAAVEYFRRQELPNIMVVTPSLVVQDKTVQNFRQGSRRYVGGFQVAPSVVSPESYDAWRVGQTALSSADATDPSMVFIFNVHQLVAPKTTDKSKSGNIEAQRTKIRKFQEDAGSLYDFLTDLGHLIVIADESHLYGSSAKAFNQALKDLAPAATIGLTASATNNDNVIYRYPLYQAISDGFVKSPVLVYRKSGYQGKGSEERQLRDALSLLRNKETIFAKYIHDTAGARHIKPALFVVCSSVAHATETSELLRSAGYCASNEAVLQVDNEHDDVVTRKLLDELDSPNSPVRVVVSVDKLKEGWDTKRIAVMCTLRAMASDVLTQQTMGRGLRLPFGDRTGVARIDQLDILAHTSFEELLNDEDILQTFGLDGAIKGGATGKDLIIGPPTVPDNRTTSTDAPTDSDVESGNYDDGTPATTDTAPPSESPSPEVTVLTHELDDDEPIDDEDVPKPVTIRINPAFGGTTFFFPSTTMSKTSKSFDLAELEERDIEDAAKRVTDSGEVLHRKKLVVSEEKQSISAERVEDVKVDSARVDSPEVAKELTRRVVGLRQFSQSESNIRQLKNRIVPQFMEAAPTTSWTEKAKDSAINELESLIQSKIKAFASSSKTETIVHPIELPIDKSFDLPMGDDVLDLLDDTQQSAFQLRKFYGDWEKGLFPAASFDSWSGEYLLAMKLNYSEDIVWWKRLYRQDRASIAYSTRDNYYPDFVALDKDGVYWIIEGKSDHGRDDDIVQAKRQAAVAVINKLVGEPKFEGTLWGYLIAYESDVKGTDSWADLKRVSAPTATKRYS